MRVKLLSIIAVIVAGVLVTLMTISGYNSVENEYNGYLSSARSNAEKEIPYNAYNNYRKAFEIRCDDEAIYLEYLFQAKLLGGDFYSGAVKDYVVKFPNSSVAYELLCRLYYESANYSALLDTALEARDKGIATDQVRDWYNECAYMLRTVKTGVEAPQSFMGGYAMVRVNGLYGFIDMEGDFLLAPVYEGANPIVGNGIAVDDGEEWHIINLAGFKVARNSEPVDSMGVFVDGKGPVSKNGKYGYVTTALVVPETLPYDYASNFKNGVAAVKKDGKWALINTEETLITKYIFDDVLLDEFNTCCNGGVIFVRIGEKYYMVNDRGEKITEKAFDGAYPFVGNEPAAICLNEKWGFVDTAGNIVIEPQYEGAKSFNANLGAVCIDGLWGYINTSENIRIACQYEDCLPFAASGIAAVKESGLWKYVRMLAYCD